MSEEPLRTRILCVLRDHDDIDLPTLEFLLQKQQWDEQGRVDWPNTFTVRDSLHNLENEGKIRWSMEIRLVKRDLHQKGDQ